MELLATTRVDRARAPVGSTTQAWYVKLTLPGTMIGPVGDGDGLEDDAVEDAIDDDDTMDEPVEVTRDDEFEVVVLVEDEATDVEEDMIEESVEIAAEEEFVADAIEDEATDAKDMIEEPVELATEEEFATEAIEEEAIDVLALEATLEEVVPVVVFELATTRFVVGAFN